jgi:MFS family permease
MLAFGAIADRFGRRRIMLIGLVLLGVASLATAFVFTAPFVQRVGLERAAWISAAAVVVGLAVYGLLSNLGYVWVAIALVRVAAGMRVVGVVAGLNVLRGLPKNRTTIGVALTETVTEVTSGVGIVVTGTILAVLFTGNVATSSWSAQQTAEFREAVRVAGLALTGVAAALVGWGITRIRRGANGQGSTSVNDAVPKQA